MATRGDDTPGLFDDVREWDTKRADRPKRIKRVATMRKAGKSLRDIAAAIGEGVSLGTVQADLKKAVEMGLDIEPEGGSVVGRDGRRQPGSRPRKQGTPSSVGTMAGLLDELEGIVADGRKLVGKPSAATVRRLASRVAATAAALTTLADGFGR